jgi:multimeric flavodoxin WrbA
MINIRKGQAPPQLERQNFSIRFRASFIDPAFRAEEKSIGRLGEIAWQAYVDGRKAPITQKAGAGYIDSDWMSEIYERCTAAHAVIIVLPVYWYQSPSPLKLMIDRLVCADGGNPDPTSTAGKKADKAKQLEMDGWDYPQHLAGRTYGLIVHGDVAGIDGSRRALADWLDWMGFIDACALARLDRYIGYYEPYATSHEALDADQAVQEEVRNVARAVAKAVVEMRSGRLQKAQPNLTRPRAK